MTVHKRDKFPESSHFPGHALANHAWAVGRFLLKAIAAEHRAPLSRLEGGRGFLSGLGTVGCGRDPVIVGPRRRGTQDRDPFGFTGFATLGCVLELLVVKEQLLPGSEDEIRP